MAWVRLEDVFTDHPKIVGLKDSAFRLHVTGLCYAARHLTDGRLPLAVVKVWRFKATDAKELLDAGLWEEADGQYLIHDFLDFNPPREQVEAEREERREAKSRAGRAGAAKRWQTDGRAIAEPMAEASQGDGTTIAPSRPVPFPTQETEPDGSVSPNGRQKRALTDEVIAEIQREEPTLDIPAFAADYLNWSGSSKHRDKVAGFRNQLRIEWKRQQFSRFRGRAINESPSSVSLEFEDRKALYAPLWEARQ